MIVGEIAESVDLLVVGGGPGGYVAAIRAAQVGRSVALVDPSTWGGLGGTCLHVGCIPSKALIELAGAAAEASNGGRPGLVVPHAEVDLQAFQVHRRQIVDGLARGVSGLLGAHDVEVITGTVRFTAPGRATVMTDNASRHLEFADVIIATGSRPADLGEVLPFDGERVLDSTGLLALEEVPSTLCIVGGGYVGLELGTAFAKLGSKVTIVEALDRLLPSLDADISALLARSLKRAGVEVLLDTLVTGFDGDELVVRDGSGAERRIAAEKVGVAVGRRPNTDALALDLLGVDVGPSGVLTVDASNLVEPHVAAIGDIVAGPPLAHKATAEAVVAAEALSGHKAAFEPQAIPAVVFSDPEVAVTGMSAGEAENAGVDVVAETFPMSALGRAATIGRTDGFVRLVADREDGTVLGAQIVGAHASELVAEATLAVEMGTTLDDLTLTIHAHPTLAEGFAEAAELASGHPIHVPPRRRGAAA